MSTARTTPAALRHQDRIKAARRRLDAAYAALQHAARRHDGESAQMWRDHAKQLESELRQLRTAALR